MINKSQEGNQVITVSLLILAIIAVAFTLVFYKTNNDTFCFGIIC